MTTRSKRATYHLPMGDLITVIVTSQCKYYNWRRYWSNNQP